MIETSDSCEEIEEIRSFALLFFHLCKAVTCAALHDWGIGTDIMRVSTLEFVYLTQNSAKQRRGQSFYKRVGVFLIEKFKKAKGSNVTIFQYLQDGYRESGSSLFIEKDEGQWVEVTPEDSAWK